MICNKHDKRTPGNNALLCCAYSSDMGCKAQQSSAYKQVMGKFRTTHGNGQQQTREPTIYCCDMT